MTSPREQASVPPLTPEDEKRPVVAFLRLAEWSDERIAEVVAAHKRGEVYRFNLTIASAALWADDGGRS